MKQRQRPYMPPELEPFHVAIDSSNSDFNSAASASSGLWRVVAKRCFI
jgi:hypothetical protein